MTTVLKLQLPSSSHQAEIASALADKYCDIWPDEALHRLWDDSLKAQTVFRLKIGHFDGSDEKNDAALALKSVDLHRLLEELGENLSEGQLLTTWESIEALRKTAIAATYAKHMASHADTISHNLVEELQRVPGAPEDVSWKYLESGLQDCLIFWSERAKEQTIEQARFDFLSLFLRHVMGAVEAPTNIWQVLLLKLESALQPEDISNQASPLEPVFRLLWDTLQLQPGLTLFIILSEEMVEADQELASKVAALAFCNAGQGKARSTLLEGLQIDYLEDLNLVGDFTAPSAMWRSILSQRLERSFSDIFTKAADRCVQLVNQATQVSDEIKELKSYCDRLGNDLAQGMQGKESGKQLAVFCQELLARSIWAATLSSNIVDARELFIPSVVRDLGLDPKSNLWNKYSRMLATLQHQIGELKSDLPWARASQLMRALDERVTEMKSRPIRWLQRPDPAELNDIAAASMSSNAREEWSRLIEMSLQRLVIEQRLNGRNSAAKMRLWTAEYIFRGNLSIETEALIASYHAILQNPKMSSTGESEMIDASGLTLACKKYAADLARISSAVRLSLKATVIAQQVAEEVILALPAYGEKIGAAGHESCIRDNRLTLLQIADVLLADVDSPVELITEWWGSVVGSYLANRPDQLFETNLTSMYRAMSNQLSDLETDIAFGIIQEVYNETLGVSCIEALAGRPLPASGPLASALQKTDKVVNLEILQVQDAELIEAVVGALEEDLPEINELIAQLVGCFLRYNQDCWHYGDPDIAAARIMPKLASISASPFAEEICKALVRACAESQEFKPKAAFVMEETVDDFVLLIAQSGVGQLLQSKASSVAKDYSEAMIAFAPDHFKNLQKEDAINRCKRDQALLYKKIGELLERSSPQLFWIDASRYFLELLSPYVDYPARMWALSFRTILKRLGSQLNPVQNLFLARWITQCESISAAWSRTHEVARSIFDANDYSFSARPEEDRPQRDLLAAVITAEEVCQASPWSGEQLLDRFLLSWSVSMNDDASIEAMLGNIKKVANSFISKRQMKLLDSVPQRLAAFKHQADLVLQPIERLAAVGENITYISRLKTYTLGNNGGQRIEFYQTIRNSSSNQSLPPVIALAAVRSHILHPLTDDAPRALASTFHRDVSSKLALRTSIGFATDVTPEAWMEWRDTNLELALSANKFRSEITSVALKWSAFQKALPLLECSEELSQELVNALKTGRETPYSQSESLCDDNSNNLAFAYAYRQCAYASFDPASTSPRLFFGTAAENHDQLDLSVAANAHTQTALHINKSMEGGGAGSSQAAAEIEADFFPLMGPGWKQLAFKKAPVTDTLITDFFRAIRGVAKDGAEYAASGDTNPEVSLTNTLYLCLESLVCGLEESGDIEASWQLMLNAVHPEIAKVDGDYLLAALYGTTRRLETHLDLEAAIFWRYILLETCAILRQSLLGHHIQANASEAAKAYVQNDGHSDSESAQKCIRDQEHILQRLGHCLSFQGPEIAWLNITSSFAEITLPHIPHNGNQLAETWRWYEAWFSQNRSGPQNVACWEWFGALQDFASLSTHLRSISKTCLPALASHLCETYGALKWEWIRWLSGIIAGSATPDSGIIRRSSTLERLMLSTPLKAKIEHEQWKDVVRSIEDFLEEEAGGRVPNLLKRSIAQIVEIDARIEGSAALGGSNLNRFLTGNAGSRLSTPLFRAYNLGRVVSKEQFVRSDKADTAVAKALGLELEDDDKLIKKLSSHKACLNMALTLQLESVKEKSGFLARIGIGKNQSSFDWRNSDILRTEANYMLETVSMLSLLGLKDENLAWCLGCAAVTKNHSKDTEEGSLKFYSALSKSLSEELGAEHHAAVALHAFTDKLNHAIIGIKLNPATTEASACFALCTMGFRKSENNYAYFKDQTPTEALEKIEAKCRAKDSKLYITDDQLSILRELATAIKQGMS